MDSVLIVIEWPANERTPESDRYNVLLHELGKIELPAKGATRLGANSWLIPLPSGLPFLGEVLEGAKKTEARYRLLFFEEAPHWLCSWKT